MARMIPEIDPSTIENSGERAAYKALSNQLPKNWVVRFHYPFCWKDGNRLKEGEADFIVVAPKRGLMVVEVKGSHGFDCQEGQWFRIKPDGAKEPAGNPFEQAGRIKHQLVKRLARKVFHVGKEKFPAVYGHLVMYPNGRVEGSLPDSTEPSLMISHKDMPNLVQRIEAAFGEWGGQLPGLELDSQDMEKIVRFLSDQTKGVPVFAASQKEDDERIEHLTQQQFRSFQGLLRGGRVHVRGPAGSGKTLLARWTAQLLADRGERILLTCYNRVLAEWLRGLHVEDKSLEVRSFFSLCRSVVMKAGLRFNPPNDPEAAQTFWKVQAPALFDEAITKLGPEKLAHYDGIIVDEGQDFHPDWWIPLMLMLKDPDKGRFCIFSDDDQKALYGLGETFPSGLFPFDLLDNCRNTRKIATYCGNIIDKRIMTMPLLPEGCPPKIEPPIENALERAGGVIAVFGSLLEQGYTPSQIAILSPWNSGNPNGALHHLGKMHGLPVIGDRNSIDDWKNGRCIWASSIKAFKGLEADCVIVADGTVEGQNSIADLYVGATRAKHQLLVLPISHADHEKLQSLL